MATGGEVGGHIPAVVGSDELLERGTIVKVKHCQFQDINVHTNTDADIGNVTGSTFLSDTALVITDFYNNSIKVVDLKKKMVVAKKEQRGSPWGICTINNDQVAVTMPPAGKIAIATVSNVDDTCNIDIDIIFHDTSALCVGIDYKDGKLAVATNDHIRLLSLQGVVLHEITTVQMDRSIFHTPGLIFDQDGKTLYVSASSRNVVRVKLDGTILDTYTDSELQCPAGLGMDNDGNVYVCGWYSDNIHQISPDCKKLRVLLRKDDGLKQPRSITFRSTDDTFWVGMSNNSNVKVYKAVRVSP